VSGPRERGPDPLAFSAVLSRRSLALWFALLALTQAGDVVTTWLGGLLGAREQNPFVQALIARGDFLHFALIKLALVAGMVLLVLAVRLHLPGRFAQVAVWRGLQLLVVAFAFVAASNAVGIAAHLGGIV
jgi:uncharacterized protein DUF5658